MRWKFAAAVLLLSASSLYAKSLNWGVVSVNARLDSDGLMHIRELQSIIFDGDWNGGERTFNVRHGQTLDFQGMSRIENGREIPLVRGDLSQVDHWDFAGANVVRWRSRLPSDPPFQNRTIVYVLNYTLSGVLEQTPDGHDHLHYDFSFPDRAGTIDYFGLTFTIDPVWSGLESPVHIVRRNLAPGQNVSVDGDLTYNGAAKPAAVHIPPTLADKLFYPISIAIAGILLTIYFYSAEVRKGLFAPLMAQSTIDDQWLQKNIFVLPPEAVGAAWDEKIGSHEVAAVIARMSQEKKLKTWVTPAQGLAKKPVLNMKLNVDWKTLPPDEQSLVQALFLGNIETDTVMIQQHYRGTGFQPQELIHNSINAALDSIPVWHQSAKTVSSGEILVGIFALFCAFLAFETAGNGLQVLVFFGGMATIFSMVAAAFVRRSTQGKTTTISLALSWLVMLLYALACFLAMVDEWTQVFCVFAAAAGIGFGALILLVSRSRDSVAKLAFRRRLAAARSFFQAQLRLAKPNLSDSWYPYLVALGLGPDVDQWFHAFPATAVGGSSGNFSGSSLSSFSSGLSTVSSGGWTGGGGAFGGAGASGSWAAISGVADGVAAPGSSGGGGGGGGGSGGGGGGGW